MSTCSVNVNSSFLSSKSKAKRGFCKDLHLLEKFWISAKKLPNSWDILRGEWENSNRKTREMEISADHTVM